MLTKVRSCRSRQRVRGGSKASAWTMQLSQSQDKIAPGPCLLQAGRTDDGVSRECDVSGVLNGASLTPGFQAFCDHSPPLLPSTSISRGVVASTLPLTPWDLAQQEEAPHSAGSGLRTPCDGEGKTTGAPRPSPPAAHTHPHRTNQSTPSGVPGTPSQAMDPTNKKLGQEKGMCLRDRETPLLFWVTLLNFLVRKITPIGIFSLK